MRLVNTEDFAVRELSIERNELMFVQHLLEASEGLGLLIAPKGKRPIVISPRSQAASLDRFLFDLQQEIGLRSRELHGAELDDVGA